MSINLHPSEITAFQRFILRFYQRAGRHQLPWRQDTSPYRVMVSELMLQQTQVDRVIPKFNSFLQQFPTLQSLAEAPISQVITQWQGLGYNRRGLNLQRAAQKIRSDFNGEVPSDLMQLMSLPGIGPYTAAAIQAFAFHLPSLVIETNIRTVFIYHFFHSSTDELTKIPDEQLLPLIAATLDHQQPHLWYAALMDYGSYLKKTVPNPTRRSHTYAKQTRFEGSNRQVRGLILKLLTQQETYTQEELQLALGSYADKSSLILEQLVKEGFVTYQADQISLPKS